MASCGFLGAPWGLLGASWGFLGASWGASWHNILLSIALLRYSPTGAHDLRASQGAPPLHIPAPLAQSGGCDDDFLGSSLGASWEPLGGLLGISWGPLGASWGPLGVSRGPFGAEGSKCPFGSPVWTPSWSRLGGLLGRLGGLLGRLGALSGRL